MAKTRLTNRMRDEIIHYVDRVIEEPELKAEWQAAEHAMKMMATVDVGVVAPEDEMAVLRKYGHSTNLNDARFVLPVSGAVVSITWGYKQVAVDGGTMTVGAGPEVPESMDAWGKIWQGSEALEQAYNRAKDAERAYHTKVTARRADYKSLIRMVRTFEALLEVWPEASEMRTVLGIVENKQLVPIDLVERIKADRLLYTKAEGAA